MAELAASNAITLKILSLLINRSIVSSGEARIYPCTLWATTFVYRRKMALEIPNTVGYKPLCRLRLYDYTLWIEKCHTVCYFTDSQGIVTILGRPDLILRA